MQSNNHHFYLPHVSTKIDLWMVRAPKSMICILNLAHIFQCTIRVIFEHSESAARPLKPNKSICFPILYYWNTTRWMEEEKKLEHIECTWNMDNKWLVMTTLPIIRCEIIDESFLCGLKKRSKEKPAKKTYLIRLKIKPMVEKILSIHMCTEKRSLKTGKLKENHRIIWYVKCNTGTCWAVERCWIFQDE